METLGQRLHHRREIELDWSQDALARRVGMSQQGINSIENEGVSRPRKLKEIAKALGVHEDWLLYGKAPKELGYDEWSELASPVGARIRTARIYADMTIPDLANAIGIGRSDLWSAEWGAWLADTRNIEAIAHETGVSLDWLTTGRGDMSATVHAIPSTPGSRLRQRRAALGMSRQDLATLSGVNLQVIMDLESGHTSHAPFAALAQALKISTAWIEHGEVASIQPNVGNAGVNPGQLGYPRKIDPREGSEQESTPNQSGNVLELDARRPVTDTQAGEATVKYKDAKWTIPEDYLQELKIAPDQANVLEMVGDAMAPTLLPGDRVVFDAMYQYPNVSGIYVIDRGKGPFIVRLQIVEGSEPEMVELVNDNPRHRSYTVPLEKIHVIGRVSGRITRL